jgi:predicted transcriptional regulator
MPRKKRIEANPRPEEPVEEEHFDTETTEGLTELDEGLSVENEEVIRWLRSWGSENELPMPRPKRKD